MLIPLTLSSHSGTVKIESGLRGLPRNREENAVLSGRERGKLQGAATLFAWESLMIRTYHRLGKFREKLVLEEKIRSHYMSLEAV